MTLPDRQLLEALTSHTPADQLGVELRIWDWNSPARDVLGDEADDVVATVLPYFRPAPAWRSLADLPKLRLLQAQSAGYDNLLHITPDGVALANAQGVHEASTSELAVGLMLAAQRELPRWARERRWQAASTRALADSRVLVVGTGAIGEAIRSRLEPFETEITRVATTARDDEHGHIHGIDELSEEDKITVNRARRIQQFLSQNTYMAEKFTNIPGSTVPLADTIEGFSMICRGDVDHIAEQAFFNVGGMEDVFANWDKMQKDL